MSETNWADLSKEEKAARIKAGREKAAAARAAAPKPVAREVRARNLDTEFRPLSEEELKKLTPAEVEARRARLTAAIDALPPVPTIEAKTLRPGTKVGEGLSADVVPFTAEWFTDVEARRKEDPGYQMHEVIPNKWGFIKVNGVAFGLAPGIRCLLPSPHYAIYMDNLRGDQKVAETFKAPEGVQVRAGYMSPVHLMPGVWQYTPMPKE